VVDANTNGRGEFFRDTSRFQFLERETSAESLLKVVSLRWALDRRSQSTRDRAREDSLRFLLACCLDLQKERKRKTLVRENRRKKFPTRRVKIWVKGLCLPTTRRNATVGNAPKTAIRDVLIRKETV
jgi:hypothetical protein